MARVFLARRDGSVEPCVLKQLHVELEDNPTAAKRFQREANIASRLHHPHIAEVISAGIEDGTFCIGMTLIPGQTVESVMIELWRRGERIPPALTVAILLATLDAAAYAHALTDEEGAPLNIVHRDLSPRNIMISFEGEVKVIDFGVARGRIDGFQTAPGMMVGTLRYMSPEQAMAEPIDRRSDLYTLGVILFEMLSGEPVITETKAVEVLNRVIGDPLPPLSDHAPELPSAIGDVIVRATKKAPRDRFDDAGTMRDALAAAAADLPSTSPEALGALVRRLFPEHLQKAEVWMEDVRTLSDDDPLDHDTLSEITSTVDRAPSAIVREPENVTADLSPPSADVPTIEAPPPKVTPVTPEPEPPRRAPPSRGLSGRVQRLEGSLRRWRSAVIVLLVALTGAIAALTWVLATPR